jgi:hypothetical protein
MTNVLYKKINPEDQKNVKQGNEEKESNIHW